MAPKKKEEEVVTPSKPESSGPKSSLEKEGVKCEHCDNWMPKTVANRHWHVIVHPDDAEKSLGEKRGFLVGPDGRIHSDHAGVERFTDLARNADRLDVLERKKRDAQDVIDRANRK